MKFNNNNKNSNKIFNLSVINIKDIFTILLIIESKIINESNLSAIIKQAESKLIKNNYLNKDDYMSIEFWYERDPSVNIKTSKKI